MKLADLEFGGPGNRDLVIPPDRDGLKLTGSCGPNTARIMAYDVANPTHHTGFLVEAARVQLACVIILHPGSGIYAHPAATGLQVSKVVVEGAKAAALAVFGPGYLVQYSQFLATDSQSGGQAVYLNAGEGKFLNNAIRFSTKSCLRLENAAATLVQGNRIAGCAEGGIVSTSGSHNRYQGNQVSEVGGSCLNLQEFAVIVGQDSKGAGQPNKLATCAGYGIALGEPSNNATVRGNTVEGVGLSAIIARSFDALIQANTLLHPGLAGVEAAGDRTWVIGNRVTASGWEGILTAGEGLRIAQNTVAEAGRDGIRHVGSHPLVEGNIVRNARGDGIDVSGERAPRVLKNTVANVGIGGPATGIRYACTAADTCDRDAGGVITRGEVAGNVVSGVRGEDGIFAEAERALVVRGNRVTDATRRGLSVQASFSQVGGPTAAEGNVVTRAGEIGILAGALTSLAGNTIQNNTAQYGGGTGLRAGGRGNTLIGNRALHNARDGIRVDSITGSVTLTGNTALGNRGDGIQVDGTSARLEKNASTGNLKGFNCSNDGAAIERPDLLPTNNCGGEGRFDHPSSGID